MQQKKSTPIVEAPEGVFRKVKTPHGDNEYCRVVRMNDFGGYSEYASVYKPKSIPFVRYSTFRIQ